MCSRYMKKPTDLTEKPKMKKTRTIEMKYPAPYSQSWSAPPQTSRRVSTNKSTTPKAGSALHKNFQSQLRFQRPDPTVPHLKYGVFPKSNRGQARTLLRKAPTECETTMRPRNKTPKGENPDPLFIVGALDPRLSRRLSRTASTHLDIKPRNVKLHNSTYITADADGSKQS